MIKKTIFFLSLFVIPIAYGMDIENAAAHPALGVTLAEMEAVLRRTNATIQSITGYLNSTHPTSKRTHYHRQKFQEELLTLEKKRDALQLRIWEQEPPTNELDRGMMLLLNKVVSNKLP
jgi:hypothetical protein